MTNLLLMESREREREREYENMRERERKIEREKKCPEDLKKFRERGREQEKR